MPNLDNSELIHALGSSWKNHKYIKKIGNRYFYTMDELRNYTNNRTKTKETSSIQPRVARESIVRKTTGRTPIGTVRSTGAFKTKQSISDTITSGVKKAGEKISDVTGLTEKKRAEAAEQLSDALAKKQRILKKNWMQLLIENINQSVLLGRCRKKLNSMKMRHLSLRLRLM